MSLMLRPGRFRRAAHLDDDLRALSPDDGKRHELIDGEHYVTPSPNIRHQELSRHGCADAHRRRLEARRQRLCYAQLDDRGRASRRRSSRSISRLHDERSCYRRHSLLQARTRAGAPEIVMKQSARLALQTQRAEPVRARGSTNARCGGDCVVEPEVCDVVRIDRTYPEATVSNGQC